MLSEFEKLPLLKKGLKSFLHVFSRLHSLALPPRRFQSLHYFIMLWKIKSLIVENFSFDVSDDSNRKAGWGVGERKVCSFRESYLRKLISTAFFKASLFTFWDFYGERRTNKTIKFKDDIYVILFVVRWICCWCREILEICNKIVLWSLIKISETFFHFRIFSTQQQILKLSWKAFFLNPFEL